MGFGECNVVRRLVTKPVEDLAGLGADGGLGGFEELHEGRGVDESVLDDVAVERLCLEKGLEDVEGAKDDLPLGVLQLLLEDVDDLFQVQ